jgi:predicted ATPase
LKTDANRLRNVKRQLVDSAAMALFRKEQPELFAQHEEWMTAISRAWKRFRPDREESFRVDLAEANSEGGSFDVFHVDSGGRKLEVQYLSAGQLELFLFIAALVLNDDREGIVFIDEPELHLDPQWHRPVLRTLTELQPNAQFIVATHSPEIFDAARSYERHFLVPEDDPRARLWHAASAGT